MNKMNLIYNKMFDTIKHSYIFMAKTAKEVFKDSFAAENLGGTIGGIASAASGAIGAGIQASQIDTSKADNALEAANNYQVDGASLDEISNMYNTAFARTDWSKNDFTQGTGEQLVGMLNAGLSGASSGASMGGIGAGVSAGINILTRGLGWLAGDIQAQKKAKEMNRLGYNANIGIYNKTKNAINNTITQEENEFMRNLVAYGGPIHNHSGDWSNGLTFINEGGTHEENPFDGVLMGFDQEGVPNLVEEGEIIYNDYVFSNRLKPSKKQLESSGLNKKYSDWTFAKIVEDLQKASAETPLDKISKESLDDMMATMINMQEEVRMKKGLKGQNRMMAFGGNKFDGEQNFYKKGYIDPYIQYPYSKDYLKDVKPLIPLIKSNKPNNTELNFNDYVNNYINNRIKETPKNYGIYQLYITLPKNIQDDLAVKYLADNKDITLEFIDEVCKHYENLKFKPIYIGENESNNRISEILQGALDTYKKLVKNPNTEIEELPAIKSEEKTTTLKVNPLENLLQRSRGLNVKAEEAALNKIAQNINTNVKIPEFIDINEEVIIENPLRMEVGKQPYDSKGKLPVINNIQNNSVTSIGPSLTGKSAMDKEVKDYLNDRMSLNDIGFDWSTLGMYAPIVDSLGKTLYNIAKPVDESNIIAEDAYRELPVMELPRLTHHKVPYKPTDRNALINPIINTGRATARDIQNIGTTGADVMNRLALNTYNTQKAIGQAYLEADRQDLANRMQNAQFNLGVDSADASLLQAAQVANLQRAEKIAAAKIADAQLREQYGALKGAAIDKTSAATTQALADLTRQNMEWNMIENNEAWAPYMIGAGYGRPVKSTTSAVSSANGGMLTRKKRRK